MSSDPMPSDPTRMSEQPALRTSRGAIWLVVGGILGAISITVLALLTRGAAGGVAVVGIVIEALLYVAMIVIAIFVSRLRLRLALLAAGMLTMAAIAVVALLAIVTSRY